MRLRTPTLVLLLILYLLLVWMAPLTALAQAAEPPATSDTGGAAAKESERPERFEWLVGTADVTYRALDLRRIEYEASSSAFGRLIPARADGVSPGLGVGVRLWFVSLMLRGDVTFLRASSGGIDDDMQLWSLDLEAALRPIQERFQPYFLIGGGYSGLAGVNDLADGQRREAEAHGGNARLGLGFDYYLTEVFTLGMRGSVDGMLLASRVSFFELAEPERVDTLGQTRARLREADGSIAGLSYAAGITFGVHYL